MDLLAVDDFRMGELEVRPRACQVEFAGRSTPLQPQIMRVLVALYLGQGQVVSRADLRDRCWDGRVVSDDALNRCMARLRKLAGATGAFEVRTFARRGYRLATSSGAPQAASALRKPAAIALAAAAVIVAVTLGVLLVGRGDASSWAPTVAVEAAPFRAGPDAASAEALESLLQTESARSGLDPVKADHASFLVRAKVGQDGPQARTSVSIFARRSGVALWTWTEAGSDPTARLRAAYRAGAALQCASRATDPGVGKVSAGALNHFLRACTLADQPDSAKEVYGSLQQVNRKAPDFAPGWSALAMFGAVYARETEGEAAESARARARAAAERALAMRPQEGWAYLALEMLAERRDWAGRDRLLAEGLRRDPDNPSLLARRGLVLAAAGRLSEAEELQRAAAVRNPFDPQVAADLAVTLAAQGKVNPAKQVLDGAGAAWPDNGNVQTARLEAAVDDPARLAALMSDPTMQAQFKGPRDRALMEQLVAALLNGSAADRQRMAVVIREGVGGGMIWPPTGVQMLSALGDVDGALALAQATQAELPQYEPTFLFKPATAGLRRDRRFLDIAQRYGLLSYWRATGVWPDFCSSRRGARDCAALSPVRSAAAET